MLTVGRKLQRRYSEYECNLQCANFVDVHSGASVTSAWWRFIIEICSFIRACYVCISVVEEFRQASDNRVRGALCQNLQSSSAAMCTWGIRYAATITKACNP